MHLWINKQVEDIKEKWVANQIKVRYFYQTIVTSFWNFRLLKLKCSFLFQTWTSQQRCPWRCYRDGYLCFTETRWNELKTILWDRTWSLSPVTFSNITEDQHRYVWLENARNYVILRNHLNIILWFRLSWCIGMSWWLYEYCIGTNRRIYWWST